MIPMTLGMVKSINSPSILIVVLRLNGLVLLFMKGAFLSFHVER